MPPYGPMDEIAKSQVRQTATAEPWGPWGPWGSWGPWDPWGNILRKSWKIQGPWQPNGKPPKDPQRKLGWDFHRIWCGLFHWWLILCLGYWRVFVWCFLLSWWTNPNQSSWWGGMTLKTKALFGGDWVTPRVRPNDLQKIVVAPLGDAYHRMTRPCAETNLPRPQTNFPKFQEGGMVETYEHKHGLQGLKPFIVHGAME